MKNFILTSLICLSISSFAYADYHCNEDSTNASMTVEHKVTHLGNTVILVSKGEETTQFYGTLYADSEGVLLKKNVIELYPYQGDTLTITQAPKMCGRGSCDVGNGQIITATLKIGASISYYSCDETKH